MLKPERVTELTRELRELRQIAEATGRSSDWAAWRGVKNEVVVHHLRLVVSCALRFKNGGVPLLDLIQEATSA